jgi:hypothetical protein
MDDQAVNNFGRSLRPKALALFPPKMQQPGTTFAKQGNYTVCHLSPRRITMVRARLLKFTGIALLTGFLALSGASPAWATFNLIVSDNSTANTHTFSSNTTTVSTGGAYTLDGYTFNVSATATSNINAASVQIVATVTAPSDSTTASNLGITAAYGGFNNLNPANAQMFANLTTGSQFDAGNSVKTKANYTDANGNQQTPYSNSLSSANQSTQVEKDLAGNSTAPFDLSSVDIQISAASGTVSFTSDAIVNLPEPSTVAMAVIGIPLLTLGLARRFKNSAKAPAVA